MDDVENLRARIDLIDAEVIALVARRRDISREIQQARAAAGDGPVSPARELAIGSAYADGLGADGRAVAEAVLVVCRGRH